MLDSRQLDLFDVPDKGRHLPVASVLRAPAGFAPKQIILAKGSLDTPEREAFVRRICGVYPDVPVEEQLDVAHNRVAFAEADPVRRVAQGKRTLVIGTINPKCALWGEDKRFRYYAERRRLSLYSFCFYDCGFCYLAARDGVWFSPAIRVYVNLPEILAAVDRLARERGKEIEFCVGPLQDGLALDALTGYSTVLIPFFAEHRYARLNVLTKCVDIEALLGQDHRGHTTLGWTLNPPEIARRYETKAPPVEKRIAAMSRCAEAGYPLEASIMPVIPHGDWRRTYLEFMRYVLDRVPLRQLTLGGISMDSRARMLLECRMGEDNPISRNLRRKHVDKTDKFHYPYGLCRALFQDIIELAQRRQPNLCVDVAIP